MSIAVETRLEDLTYTILTIAAPRAWRVKAASFLTAAFAAEVFSGPTANILVIVGKHDLDEIKKALRLPDETPGLTHEVISGETASQRGLLPPQNS